MRETFKSLSIFSAMLMLLLMISTGCDINIPGCGKRSLPFFSTIPSHTAPVASATSPAVVPPASSAYPQTITSNLSKLVNNPGISTVPKVSTVVPLSTPTPVPVDVEKIAYTTMEEGQPTLWTMNTDGTERTRLTSMGTSSWHPLWSPNGKTLAFLSTANDGKVNLYILQKGDDQLVQLTNWNDMPKPDPAVLQPSFSWSPKSDQLAYIYKNQIWVIQLDTLEQSTLVTVDNAYSISSIDWAPHRDNKYIAYTVRKGVNYYSVMLVNPRLKDKLTMADSNKSVSAITWTSGAEKLAYLSDNKVVDTTTVEDTTPKPLINQASPDLGPFAAFSPADANYRLMLLAKQTSEDTGYRVAIVDQEAKNDQDKGTLKYLTPAGVDYAAWSPEGNKIAYVISGELWTMDSASGLNKTRIALTGIQSPDWSKK